MYPMVLKVLVRIGKYHSQKSKWKKCGVARVFESFDFIFNLHMMLVILGYKADQNLVNPLSFDALANDRIHRMRSHEWEGYLQG